MERYRTFNKPTGIAVFAAVVGVAIHVAVFFFVRIQIETPEHAETPAQALSFIEGGDSESVSLLDPLSLLISSDRVRPGPQLEDFRALSISREISLFPPFLSLKAADSWKEWVPEQEVDENAQAFILEQNASSLQSFGRSETPGVDPQSESMTIRILDLGSDEISFIHLAVPPSIEEVARDSSFVSPGVFLIDQTSNISRPTALRVKSTGDLTLDATIREFIADPENQITTRRGYYQVTVYLPSLLAKSAEDATD
ncbi:MAG: hypothetical protein AAGJ81_01075 [Verrucomicrobiota bacterium]